MFLHRRDSTTALGSLCQCSVTFTAQYSLMVRGNLLCSSLFPFPFVLALSTTEKSLAPSSLVPCTMFSYTVMRSPWSCLISRFKKLFTLLCWTLFRTSTSLLYWEAQHWMQYSRCVSPVLNKEEGSPLASCCQSYF